MRLGGLRLLRTDGNEPEAGLVGRFGKNYLILSDKFLREVIDELSSEVGGCHIPVSIVYFEYDVIRHVVVHCLGFGCGLYGYGAHNDIGVYELDSVLSLQVCTEREAEADVCDGIGLEALLLRGGRYFYRSGGLAYRAFRELDERGFLDRGETRLFDFTSCKNNFGGQGVAAPVGGDKHCDLSRVDTFGLYKVLALVEALDGKVFLLELDDVNRQGIGFAGGGYQGELSQGIGCPEEIGGVEGVGSRLGYLLVLWIEEKFGDDGAVVDSSSCVGNFASGTAEDKFFKRDGGAAVEAYPERGIDGGGNMDGGV